VPAFINGVCSLAGWMLPSSPGRKGWKKKTVVSKMYAEQRLKSFKKSWQDVEEKLTKPVG